MTILITTRSFGSGNRDLIAELKAAGHQVVRGPSDHRLEALAEPLSSAVAWIAGVGDIGPEHLDLSPQLRIIARHGVGYDAVDLAAAAARDIAVTITPGANSEAVAEHAVALMLGACRSLPAGDRAVRDGQWRPVIGRQLAGAIVGVIGFGRIGRVVGQRLGALGSTVLAHDPFVDDATVSAFGAQPASVDEIRQRAMAVSLHAPGGNRVVDEAWLGDCRVGQLIVNTARADLLAEHAVAAALRDGRLGGLATDVLASEHGDDSPLLADDIADRVVFTPHVASQTAEAIDAMGSMAVAEVLAVLAGGDPQHPVRAQR